MRNIAYYNGKIGPTEEMTVPINDRALYFGDGIYDVATMIDGKFFALEDHIDRFFRCCTQLEMPLRITKEEFRGILKQLREQLDSDIENAVFYFQASRGVAPRNHVYPEGAAPTLMVTVKESPAPAKNPSRSLISLPDLRFQLCNIKTLNLIPNVMASQRAKEAGAVEAILHKDGRVTEGSHTGTAILKNGVVITPPLNNELLPSVTRKHLLEICKDNHIPLEERFYTLEELQNADEAMILSTTKLFFPVNSLDGKPLGGKDPALLNRLLELYKAYIPAHSCTL